jgi:hypothetical protein
MFDLESTLHKTEDENIMGQRINVKVFPNNMTQSIGESRLSSAKYYD